MAKTKTHRDRPLALAYIRVSTAEQADSGASLAAQRHSLEREAELRGWDVEIVADEGLSAKTLNRPALQGALARLDAGEADFLLAIRLDRISRSVADFAGLLDRATKRSWGLVLLSPNIDTSDPAGRFTSNVLASAAQYERELIGMRTREGMLQRKAEGVRLGRPSRLSSEVLAAIVTQRAAGVSLARIADDLNASAVPTATGKAKWYPSTILAVLRSQDAAALAA